MQSIRCVCQSIFTIQGWLSFNSLTEIAMKVCLLFFSILLFFCATAAETVFSVDFNKSKIRGIKADGTKVLARYEIKPKIVDGINGKACLLDKTSLHYSANDIINPSLGAVSFWIKPIDWGDKNINCLPIFALPHSPPSRQVARHGSLRHANFRFRHPP